MKTALPIVLDHGHLARAAKHLSRRDDDLASILRTLGPPPMWARQPGFATLIKIILEQQVSLASAAALFSRLRKTVTPFRPSRVLELGENHLKSVGLTRQKAAYCIHLSQALVDRRLNLSHFHRMTDDEVRTALTAIKGLGAWSADVYLLMAMRRSDIWPVDDLALRVAITRLRNLRERPSSTEFLKMAESWRPYRSVAARMLWQYYLAERRNRVEIVR